VLVTGGAGYIGCVLVPRLLQLGHEVLVYDRDFFGYAPLQTFVGHPNLVVVEGDVRDQPAFEATLKSFGPDIVIHLAAMSNDPSSNVDPELTKSVNMDATAIVMKSSKEAGVRRFLYASSASVYGIKEETDVTEDLSLHPITLYAKYKRDGELVLNDLCDNDFCGASVRAATVCGYSPRLRLDLTVNILTSHALENGVIKVFGGTQMRPNIHIEDLADFYVTLCGADADIIRGEAFNVTYENASVMQLAERIRERVSDDVEIEVVPTDDLRSYHLSGEKADRLLEWTPARTVSDAVDDLVEAWRNEQVPDWTSDVYRNVKHLQANPDEWLNP
jgi:nucleoside-diphosphate-sugar epimerase